MWSLSGWSTASAGLPGGGRTVTRESGRYPAALCVLKGVRPRPERRRRIETTPFRFLFGFAELGNGDAGHSQAHHGDDAERQPQWHDPPGPGNAGRQVSVDEG